MVRLLYVVAVFFAGVVIADEQASVVLTVGKTDLEKVESVYLQHFTDNVVAAIGRVTTIHYVSSAFQFGLLAKSSRCRHLIPKLRQWQIVSQQHAFTINRQEYFQHLVIVSLALLHLQRKLQQLALQKHRIELNLMENFMHRDEARASVEESERKINAIADKINSLFSRDSSNMLLMMKVKQGKTDFRFYQKIVSDYYAAVNAGKIGTEIVVYVQRENNEHLKRLINKTVKRSEELLHLAWRHTCAQSRLKRQGAKRLLFYSKHKLLVEQVKSSLADSDLLAVHDRMLTNFARRTLPSYYHVSGKSFFGLMGSLVIPSLFVPKKHNKLTLPLMAAAGATVSWQKVNALRNIRQQLLAGVFNNLNTYADYRAFADNTSVSKYTFSHLAAIALALVIRKMPKPHIKGLSNVDTKMLVKINVGGSLVSLFAIEAMQTKSLNFMKDRDFFYNILTLMAVDAALGYLSSANLSNETRIAAISAATLLTSVLAHVASGKEINWDRIIFDTTFVSTYSMYKSTYFYTKGSRLLVNKLNINTKAGQTGIMSVMSVVSNALGNVPYSLISRQWIEKKIHLDKKTETLAKQDTRFLNINAELNKLLEKHQLADKKIEEIFSIL